MNAISFRMNAISFRAKNISSKMAKKASDTRALTNTVFHVNKKVTWMQGLLSGVALSISISIKNKHLVNINRVSIALHLSATKKLCILCKV
uniref:Uncharacterized protein n=1 Tax=Tupiella akineta TaxID=160070 RepID=Q6UVQ4_TUPAK|nr:hypothetical protein PsakpMp57 [Tupiella akineta]AAQ18770.1 hypothetical protein [Tupiella akineta]